MALQNLLTTDELNEGLVKINANNDIIDNHSGWAEYRDTQYTSGSPFAIVANTLTDLPNNSGIVIDSQKPSDFTTFYDSTAQKITGRNGDGLAWSIEIILVPSVSAEYVNLSVDIGGTIGEVFMKLYSFPKGAGVERSIIYTIPSAYTLDTWETNGGQVKVISNGACNIHGIRYVFTRTHKAK
tara:strand:- start:75 stop:623 length:549 start_codon:yes stop_codon:yes gene_type:complete